MVCKNYAYNHLMRFQSLINIFITFSTNESTPFFLHLQFLWSKYFPTLHGLLHSQLQLLGFKTNPLSHSCLSTNYLHSHLHLSSFQLCLLLQTLEFNLHSHLQLSCHFYVFCLITP